MTEKVQLSTAWETPFVAPTGAGPVPQGPSARRLWRRRLPGSRAGEELAIEKGEF